jgi:hypothetical protein
MATTTTHHRSETAEAAAGGLVTFAGVLLFIAGILDLFRGIMANDDVYVNTPNYVFKFDLTSWGWIQLVLGVIAMSVSAGLFSRATWARVVGVGIAGLLIIANFLSIPYYPVWSLTLIALYAFVIMTAPPRTPGRRGGLSPGSRLGHGSRKRMGRSVPVKESTGAGTTSARTRRAAFGTAQPFQVQSSTSGRSVPWMRIQSWWRWRASSMRWRTAAARTASPGTRSMTSMTSR